MRRARACQSHLKEEIRAVGPFGSPTAGDPNYRPRRSKEHAVRTPLSPAARLAVGSANVAIGVGRRPRSEVFADHAC
jgi:hypothetical protein